MPCFDPTLNLVVTIEMKIPLGDKEALELALYDLAKDHKMFFYEKTATGYEIRSEWGRVTLIWDGSKYIAQGTAREGQRALSPILSKYSAIKFQRALIEKGYMTEEVPLEKNSIKLTARRI